jgi:hypothetical protein
VNLVVGIMEASKSKNRVIAVVAMEVPRHQNLIKAVIVTVLAVEVLTRW